MDESFTAQYGGYVTADALLTLEEEVGASSTDDDADSPATERQKLDTPTEPELEHSKLTLSAHRAVLWAQSEYFASKVGLTAPLLCVLLLRLAQRCQPVWMRPQHDVLAPKAMRVAKLL